MPHLSDFQATLFDIDRTLIPPSREIFPEVVAMLKKLHDSGVKTGLCSGRGFPNIANKLVALFPEDALHILAGGSILISNTGKVIWQQTIDPGTIAQLQKMILESGAISVFNKPNVQYSGGDLLKTLQDHPWRPIVADLSEMNTEDVGLIYLQEPNQEIVKYITTNPHLNLKYMVSNQGHNYYDITANGVTKALALQEWSKATSIPLEKVIGFGDSLNDIEYLQSCGYAVAMGNADANIKAIANTTIGIVTEKGLPTYVQAILEGAPL